MGSCVLSNSAKTTTNPMKTKVLAKKLECVTMLLVIVLFQSEPLWGEVFYRIHLVLKSTMAFSFLFTYMCA